MQYGLRLEGEEAESEANGGYVGAGVVGMADARGAFEGEEGAAGRGIEGRAGGLGVGWLVVREIEG